MKVKLGFRVSIDAEALEKVWHWTALAAGEFSCLAMVTDVEDGLLVNNVELFEQVCTAASTELDQGALARFLVSHAEPEKVRCWIHSHGNLNTFWSQQDDSCIEGLANPNGLVSVVVNKKHSLICRVDLWHPVRVTLDDLALEVRLPGLAIKRECERVFRENVTEIQPVVSKWTPGQAHLGPSAPQRNLGSWPGWDDEEFPGWRGP